MCLFVCLFIYFIIFIIFLLVLNIKFRNIILAYDQWKKELTLGIKLKCWLVFVICVNGPIMPLFVYWLKERRQRLVRTYPLGLKQYFEGLLYLRSSQQQFLAKHCASVIPTHPQSTRLETSMERHLSATKENST